MKLSVQKSICTLVFSTAGLFTPVVAMAIDCPTSVSEVNLDVATQTVSASGTGFNASYSGQNSVIYTYLALNTFQPNFLVTYSVDAASCVSGGDIEAIDI